MLHVSCCTFVLLLRIAHHNSLGGGCSCDTPATHTELWNEPRQGCSYTVERDRGGVASVPLSLSAGVATIILWLEIDSHGTGVGW